MSQLIEIIGPAGAGKSSLLRELKRQNPALSIFADRLKARELKNLPFYVGSGLAALPTLLRPPWQERWYTREEISRILYLVGMRLVFQRHMQRQGVTVVDQGPIFELTHLRAFGPARLGRRSFAPWWDQSFRRWASMVPLVVWLDAPDEVLIPRVRAREQAHLIKQIAEAEAQTFLAHYRTSFAEVIEQLQRYAPIKMLPFTTSVVSVEAIAQRTLQEIEQMSDVHRSEKSTHRTVVDKVVH